MSGAQELAEQIEADKDQIAETGGRIGAAKDAVAEVAVQVQALGMGRVAEALAAAERLLEEAESGRQTLEGSLEKARWQVMAAIHGVGPGAPTSRYGEMTGGPDGAPPQGVPDILPPHLRTAAPSGEELMGQDPSLSPFQKEHENADADRNMNRLSRFGRATVRNTGSLKSFGEDLTSSANSTLAGLEPADPSSYTTTTEQPTSTPQLHSPPAGSVNPTDLVGTAIVMAAVVVEGAGRLIERRKRRKHGG